MRALLILVLAAVSAPALAQSFEFEGRIEAVQRAELASRLDGRIAEILFRGGEAVSAGQPLLQLERDSYGHAVAIAEARLAEAVAQRVLAEDVAARADTLSDRGVGSLARQQDATAALAMARAGEQAAEAALDSARLDFEDTLIRAPIAGLVSRPSAATGGFVEAKAGPPLATIVQIDPVLVAYEVPYADRLTAMEGAAASTVDELLQRVDIRLVLPNGEPYPLTSRPAFAEATVAPDSGTLTVWAEVANPDLILRPGMPVHVISTIVDVAATDAPAE